MFHLYPALSIACLPDKYKLFGFTTENRYGMIFTNIMMFISPLPARREDDRIMKPITVKDVKTFITAPGRCDLLVVKVETS